MTLRHRGRRMPSSHDIIVRYVVLLPEGVEAGDWEAARRHIDALPDERAAELSRENHYGEREMDWGWTDEEVDGTAPAPGIAESWRRYLHLELDELLVEGNWPMYVKVEWKGRKGFLCEGYGFDEEPSETVGFRRLLEAGVIEAAGYEVLP